MLRAFSIYVEVVDRGFFEWRINAYTVVHLSANRRGLFREGGM